MLKFIIKHTKTLPIPFSRRLISMSIEFLRAIFRNYILNTSSSRGPLFITWMVTFDCNAFCVFCSTHSQKKKFTADLSREKAIATAHEIGKSKVKIVGFTGGEVLLWPYLFDVIKILKSYNIAVYLVTNGHLLKEKADEILENRVDSITVSIDSCNSEEHDSLRNLPGLFKTAIEGIQYLKKKRHGKYPIIKSTTVLTQQNIHTISQTIEYLSRIVDHTSIQPISFGYENHPHSKNTHSMKSLLFDNAEYHSTQSYIDQLCDQFPQFNTSYFRNIPAFIFNPITLQKKIKCWSPFFRLIIMPDGEVFHCIASPAMSSLGNINKSSFMQIWNGSQIRQQRDCIRKHQNNCLCWTQDVSFNALMYSLKLPNKLPTFNKSDMLP
ncbi:MAG: radical SAM protein [Oligoflexia bacterium]|nr:radical SAM protein [Oligoflexia bacterium]